MINNFLLELSQYAKENNYPFKRISISFNIMPQAFYDTIIGYLKKAFPLYIDNPKIKSFDIVFKNNKAYIEILGNNNKTRAIIISDYFFYDNLPAAIIIKATKIARDIQILDEVTNTRIIKNLPQEFVDRYIKTNNNIVTINVLMEKSLNNILGYAKYLQKAKECHMDTISFNDPTIDSPLPKNPNSTRFSKKIRQHDEISIEERRKILDEYEHVYEFNAESNSKASKYYIKVFKKTNKQYRIIMEPIEANKYIKVLYIDANRLDKQQIMTLVVNALQSSYRDLSRRTDATIHKHTTKKAYKNLIEYIVNDKDLGISHSTKTMILQAKKR